MKKRTKIILYIVASILIVIAGLFTYVIVGLPNVGAAPVIKIDANPARIERGKYLANHVTICIDCHSTRDWTKLTGPVILKTIGSGGERFDKASGLPGNIYSANITPYNLASWTDGEIFRAITTGVKKDGSAIFPIMPYNRYREMDREDIYSIIAYIRTLSPLQSTTPKRELDFPVNLIVNTIPVKAALQNLPAPATRAYGAYITNAAACFNCHTDEKDGKLAGEAFAGKREFKLPGGSVFSSNITPDKETGIGNWDKETFVAKFKSYADSGHVFPAVADNSFQTVMPWSMYSGMADSDLQAIYDYLRTVAPAKNAVVKFIATGR
jgi:cytochrome c553